MATRSPRRPTAYGRGPTAEAGAAALVRPALERVGFVSLPLGFRFWDGSELPSTAGPTLVFREPKALAFLLRAPSQLGLARAWVAGALELDGELEPLLVLRDRVRELGLGLLDRVRLGLTALRVGGLGVLASPPVPAAEARQRGRLHSLGRDRQAIRHHYDISNAFYQLLLGPSMTYSAAYFTAPSDSLEEAQERKLELICARLRLESGERLLDIGCGWGSLLLHAAERHGVRGVGITLSDAQAELARARVRAAGLADQIEIRIADYRRLTDGPYDKVASIGMYEHVGLANYGAYARTVRRLLRPGGLFLNDGIARLFSSPPRRPTFISRYVFPDGELHPLSPLVHAFERARLEPRELESTREHYAETCRRWYANLRAHRAEAEAQIGPERRRVWELYLIASALGFDDGDITNYQLLVERPR